MKKFPISSEFFFKVETSSYKGYSWVYLCKKGSNDCMDIYKQRDTLNGQYFQKIEEIKITKILNDTVCYTAISVHLGSKQCISDTVRLTDGLLLSKNSNISCN